MKKKFDLIVGLFLLFATISVAQDKTLTILHTNDTHSCIYPLNPNLVDTMVAGRGGFIRRIAMLTEERKKDPGLLLFDSGDFSQGSPYYTLYKGEVEIKLMNRMGYDAVTIGNHEFDFGVDNLANLLKMAQFPIVCTNYDFTGTSCEGLVKPYIVMKRNGIRIGVFSVAPALDGLVDAKNCQGVKYLNPQQVALETATMLKKQKKCDLVICLSHLGWSDKGKSDQWLIANTRNIDLVLGGHSHTYLRKLEYVKNMDGNPVAVDQNGKQALFVGKMKLKFNKVK